MNFNLVADSCCDLSPELQKTMDIHVGIAPLTIIMDEKLYVDDDKIDMSQFMEDLASCKKVTSGAPSPASYLDEYKDNCMNFSVTISSKVSGSYASAVAAADICDKKNCRVHVFDSKSASAAQMLTLIKIKELIDSKIESSQIISTVTNFIDSMKTYYISQDLSVFIKSGRLGKIKGNLLTALGIRPILGTDGNGEIAFYSHARGENQTITKFINLIKESGKKTTDNNVVITHCNNIELANKLKEKIEQFFDFKKIIVAPTRGLSSMYVNNKGLIISF